MLAFAPENIRIFYADDDVDDIFFFSNAVDEIGWHCRLDTFPNGVELLEHLNIDYRYHNVIFLDINMPLKNGIECLKDIKSNNKWSLVPVFIISTSNSHVLREKVMGMGASGFIEKPSDFNDLKEKIKEVVTGAWPGVKQNN